MRAAIPGPPSRAGAGCHGGGWVSLPRVDSLDSPETLNSKGCHDKRRTQCEI